MHQVLQIFPDKYMSTISRLTLPCDVGVGLEHPDQHNIAQK